MRKIGIITIPRADNFGSVLQAYAMQVFVDSINNNNEVIDYVSPFLVDRYHIWNLNKNSLYGFCKSLFQNIMTFRFKISKKSKFEEFRKNIRFSNNKIYLSSEIDDYSSIICGSDQIWNTRITQSDTAFFLDFANLNTNRIAFAVSMGYEDRTDNEIDFYFRYVKKFNYIGIREKNDVDFIQKICNDDCQVSNILDPTLLVDQFIWEKMITKKKMGFPYVLIYSFGRDDRIVNVAKSVAEQKNCRVYVIGDEWRKINKDGFYVLPGVGPIDFISLISGAEFIVTNSFHGTAFSIVFKKPFLTVPYIGTENRMVSLLKLLDMEKQIYKEDMDINFKIDYLNTYRILDKQRKKARNFLRQALSEELL